MGIAHIILLNIHNLYIELRHPQLRFRIILLSSQNNQMSSKNEKKHFCDPIHSWFQNN